MSLLRSIRQRFHQTLALRPITSAAHEHHEEFLFLLTHLNDLLPNEIQTIDGLLTTSIREGRDFPSDVSNFCLAVAKLVFADRASQVVSDYSHLAKILTSGGFTEETLRGYYLHIISEEFHYDIVTGKSNLSAIAGKFVEATDRWIYAIMAEPRAEVVVDAVVAQQLDGDELRLVRIFMYWNILLLVSAVCLHRLRSLKHPHSGEDVVALVSKVYYGHSLSLEQYDSLCTLGLQGGVAFRGIYLVPKDALRILGQKELFRGVSWTTRYRVAISFASRGDLVSGVVEAFTHPLDHKVTDAGSVQVRLQEIRRGSVIHGSLFFDDPVFAQKTLVHVLAIPTVSCEGVGVILSHLVINEHTLLYLGSQSAFPNEKELLLALPEDIPLTPYSVDIGVSIRMV